MRRFALFSVLFPLLTLLGCVQVTQLHQTPRGLELRPEAGVPLNVIFSAAELPQIAGRTVEVRVLPPLKTIDATTSNIKQLKPEEWEPWRVHFQKAMAGRLYQCGLFRDVSTPNDMKPLADPDLRFDIAVTEWDEGIGWMRYVIGFGAGRTKMQWEGALVDARARRVLFAFGDKREHPGGPAMLGFNFKPFYGGTLIAQDLTWGMDDLVKTLQKQAGVDDTLDKTRVRPEYHPPLPPTASIQYRLGPRLPEWSGGGLAATRPSGYPLPSEKPAHP